MKKVKKKHRHLHPRISPGRLVRDLLKLLFDILKAILFLPFRLLSMGLEKLSNLFRFSISFKINFVYILIFISILIPFSFIVNVGLRFFVLSEIESNLNIARTQVFRTIPAHTSFDLERLAKDLSRQKLYFSLYEEDKKLLFSSFGNQSLDNMTDTDLRTQIFVNKDPYIQKTFKAYINKSLFYVTIVKDISLIRSYLNLFVFFLFLSIFMTVLIASLIGSKISKRMLNPIRKMTETVREISINNLSQRLDIKGSKDELKDLAITFNSMVDDIQSSYEKQNQFVSDASHELRTPISVIQGYINLLDRWGKEDESVLEEAISAIKEESESMKDLVEKLLYLARMDKNKFKLEKDMFSIKELMDEVFKETRMIDEKHNISALIDFEGSIYGDRKSIKQMLRILVDNSIKFTPEGGDISLGLRSSELYVIVTIRDSGLGIPKEDLPYVFNRFYRSDKSRTKSKGGNGLGLSIAKWIIDQHDALVEIQSELDVGTKITIAFPKK